MACGQTSSAGSRPTIDVMFLCDEWKSCEGGLSTFNREFAVNLAKTVSDSIKVHCYVSQSDELSKEDARQHGVELITAQNFPGSDDPLDWLKLPPPELPNPDIVVGHGRKFGTPAYCIARAAKCKWMHFVHVFCEDLGKFKATQSSAVDTIEENEKKHKCEIELCKVADVVVAVGSRLQQKYSNCLPHVKVEIITPGIFEKFSIKSSQLVKDKLVKKKFSVFMFGRASFEDLTLKGYDIVVANAIGSLEKMFELTFVGSSSGEHRKIEQWFLDNTCISRNQLTIRGYCNEQDELTEMFHEPDMVAIPSRTEGFGLVALEAISAGIPVLVAGETGIAEALHEVEGGKSVIVESDNPEEWARRIQLLSRQSSEERENNAKLLRDNYAKTYSWSCQCKRFERMIQDLAESLNALKLRIDVEIMTPAEQNTQDGAPVSTGESGDSHIGGHQEAFAAPLSSRHTKSSCTGTEADPQAPSPILITEIENVLSLIASNYLLTTPPRCKTDHDDFLAYMEKMRLVITGVGIGSLLITVKCTSLEILETLWEDYSSGHLGEVVQRCFVTEEILTELSLAELKLQTTISEEEYIACKMHFEKDPAQEEDGKELPVYKVVLCGESGVGKTSIFRRLQGDGFEVDTSKFKHLAEEKIKVQVEEKTIIIDLWDTYGMERYSRLTRQHYLGSSVVLLVYDCDDMESLTDLAGYYEDAKHNASGAAMVLVRNKIDQELQCVGIKDAEKLLCNHKEKDRPVCKFKFRAETSAKDNTGINELIQRVAKYLLKNAEPSNSRREFDKLNLASKSEPQSNSDDTSTCAC